jgi:hypothetical protein
MTRFKNLGTYPGDSLKRGDTPSAHIEMFSRIKHDKLLPIYELMVLSTASSIVSIKVIKPRSTSSRQQVAAAKGLGLEHSTGI